MEEIIFISASEANKIAKDALAKTKAEHKARIQKGVSWLMTMKIKPSAASGEFTCSQPYSSRIAAREVADVLSENGYEVKVSGSSTDATLEISWE